MSIRAVICDVYHTLMEVQTPPHDAAQRWAALCREMLGAEPELSLEDFHARSQTIIAREHDTARARGIPHPEVYWPDIAIKTWPRLAPLTSHRRHEFLIRHAALIHTVRPMPGAAEALQAFFRKGILLGIASNAQPYTLAELAKAHPSGDPWPSLFHPACIFWSFENGFGKPDPHVYRVLSARLRHFGICARETLMVGDRLDNDIEPAHSQGWQTWHLTQASHESHSGGWHELRQHLAWI